MWLGNLVCLQAPQRVEWIEVIRGAQAGVVVAGGDKHTGVRARDRFTGAAHKLVQRSIGADRCQALVESTAFIIAVALDPNFGAVEEEPVEPPAPEPEPEPPEPEPEPVRTPTWIYGSLGGGVRRGAWPTGAAVEATVGFAGAAWRVELSGAFDVPQQIAAASPNDDISMQVQVARGVLRGCAYKRVERVAFPVCGVLELGSIDARGRGLTTSRREQRLWAAAGLRGAMEVTLGGPVALGLHVDGMVPFIEHRFVADPEPVTEIYRSGAAEFRAGGYLRVRLGAVGASDRRKSGSRGS